MSTFSPKQHLTGTIQFVHSLLVKDMNAVSADKANVAPAPNTRPALSLIAECASVNALIASRIETGAMPERLAPDARKAFLATFDTPEKALAYLDEATKHLVHAIETCDESKFGDPVMTPLGVEMTIFGLAEFAAMHMMYHDGQVNYTHLLHGDTEMHWS